MTSFVETIVEEECERECVRVRLDDLTLGKGLQVNELHVLPAQIVSVSVMLIGDTDRVGTSSFVLPVSPDDPDIPESSDTPC